MSTESLIELGERLVQEFKLEDKTDTLSQWMLHYLAELFGYLHFRVGFL